MQAWYRLRGTMLEFAVGPTGLGYPPVCAPGLLGAAGPAELVVINLP